MWAPSSLNWLLKVNYFPEERRGTGHDLPAWSQVLIISVLETDPCNPTINHSSEQSAYLKFHTGRYYLEKWGRNNFSGSCQDSRDPLVLPSKLRNWREGKAWKEISYFPFLPSDSFWQNHLLIFILREIIFLISGNIVFIFKYLRHIFFL